MILLLAGIECAADGCGDVVAVVAHTKKNDPIALAMEYSANLAFSGSGRLLLLFGIG
jgi:hypothetical protein